MTLTELELEILDDYIYDIGIGGFDFPVFYSTLENWFNAPYAVSILKEIESQKYFQPNDLNIGVQRGATFTGIFQLPIEILKESEMKDVLDPRRPFRRIEFRPIGDLNSTLKVLYNKISKSRLL